MVVVLHEDKLLHDGTIALLVYTLCQSILCVFVVSASTAQHLHRMLLMVHDETSEL